jgi:DNA polymerase-3 subunit alpha
MGDTDQVVALMDDAREMGLEVLPPDVNESRENFTVVADKQLRFGLGAVKNLGSKAIEAIIDAREEEGPFKTLFDFCERVDHHAVSKSALEALVNAGCFDKLPGERAQIMAVMDTAMKAGARVRKNRAMGQSALFGGGDETAEEHQQANLPDVPPLSAQELARRESEALGLYVRYDPLVDHRRKLLRFANCFSDEIGSRDEGSRAVMGGMIENVARKTTRTKKPMAILQVLGPRGMFEVVVFPNTWEDYGEFCQVGQVMFFEGPISHNRGTSLNADEIIPFEKAPARLGASVYVTVPCQSADAGLWEDLARIIDQNQGRVPCYVDLEHDGIVLRTRVNNGTLVAPTDRLADQIEDLVGAGSVRFGLRENNNGNRNVPHWKRRKKKRG